MANLEYCFFCCKNILIGNHESNKTNIINENVDHLNYNSEINNSAQIKEHVSRISHYLKVPRKLIEHEWDTNSIIKCCSDCTEISENLSSFCCQLETTKMKIGYYLTQLNYKIAENSIDFQYDNFPVRNREMSNFQTSVHQKCLQKVRHDDYNRNPEIRLRKLPNPPKKIAQQIKLEDDHDEYPLILEEAEDRIKIETEPMSLEIATNEELHSCPFCTFVVNGSYEELQSHLTSQHPDQFQSEEDNGPIDQKNDSSHRSNTTAFKCKSCGKCFSLRSNLRRHITKSSVCGTNRATNVSNHQSDRYKVSKCEYCGMLVTARNLKRHVDYRHPNGITLVSKRKEMSCEYCNIIVGNSRKLRVHMLECHGVEMPGRLHKCEGCNNSYELKSSLFRHLRRSDQCKRLVNRGKIVRNKVGQGKRKEFENIEVSNDPENDEDIIVSVGEIELSVEEEDPLAIY